MATLVVRRDHPRDIGYREAILHLDGVEVENLASGDRFVMGIGPGVHELRAHNRFFRSKAVRFKVEEDDTAFFTVGNIPNGCYALLLFLQMAPPSIVLFQVGANGVAISEDRSGRRAPRV